MNTRTAMIFFAVAASCLVPSWAHAAPSLSLEEVLTSVERTHPTLESADRDVDEAKGKAMAARGGFDPNLSVRGVWNPVGFYNNGQVDAQVEQATPLWGMSLNAGYRVGLGTYPVYKGQLQTLSAGELRAGLDIPVLKDGPIDSRRAKIQRTRIRTRVQTRVRDAAQLELERRATTAYWTWVAAGQSLDVARELLAIAERRDAALNEQAASGAIERIKITDNRRLVLDRMSKVIAAERKFAETSLELSLYLRDQDLRPVVVGEERVPKNFPAPDPRDRPELDDAVRQAMAARPDLAAIEAERAAANVDVRLTRNQRAPGINLQTFVTQDFGRGPAELAPTEWGAGVTLRVALPLREARGMYRAAKAKRASVDAKLRGLTDKVGVEVRRAHVALEAAAQNVAVAREQVGVAVRLAEAERTRFGEGISDLVIVNLRELAVAEASNLEIEALADYQRSRADYLVAAGQSPG